MRKQTTGGVQHLLNQLRISLAQFQAWEIYLPPSYCIKLDVHLQALSQQNLVAPVHDHIDLVRESVLSYRSQEDSLVRRMICELLEALIDKVEGGEVQHVTPREREVLIHILRGYSNKQIAQTLEISPQTVKNHTVSLLNKLHAQNRVHAVVKALQWKIISLEESFSDDQGPPEEEVAHYQLIGEGSIFV